MTNLGPRRYWGDHDLPESRAPLNATIEPKPAGDGKTATIRLYDPIDSWGGVYGVSAKEFAAAMDALPEGVDTIELHINSPGGEVTEGYAILNALRDHSAKVNVTVDGLAASAASYVAMAGDKITMARNSQMMVHRASGLVIGNAEDMAEFAGVLDKMDRNIAGIYSDRAGGSVEDWLGAMTAETWYLADEAVEAGLADQVAPKPAKATNRFDLSIFAHAGRADAPPPAMPAKASHKPPAEPPEKPPTIEEADAMSDTTLKALRERLGLADDADDSAITARVDELKAAADAKPTEPDKDSILDAIAKLGDDDMKAVVAELTKDDEPNVPDGKVLVSENVLAELRDMAKDGADARAKQLEQERDETIEAAFKAGKISAGRRESWSKAWDKDPAGTKADLDDLPVRFPVGQPSGYAGSDGSDGDGSKPFSDDEADALASLAGVSKEALING